MRTQRQPTIKTWFLLTAVVALLCVSLDGPHAPELFFVYGFGIACEIVFWTVTPLVVGIACRSIKISGMLCCGLGCLWILLDWLMAPHLLSLWSDYLDTRTVSATLTLLSGITVGPFMCVAFLHGGIPALYVETGWLVAYTLVGMLFAKSCRVREQPGRPA